VAAEDIDNFSLAFIAPLGPENYCCFCWHDVNFGGSAPLRIVAELRGTSQPRM
jgi:hypothetical protein